MSQLTMKMIFRALLVCVALCCMTAASAGLAVRAPDESLEDFVFRYAPPASTIVHKIIETTEWMSHGKSIIVFFQHPYPPPNNDSSLYGQLLTGMLFVPTAGRKYEVVAIETYGPEGRTAEIDSVFFAHTNRSAEKALFVLVSWHPNPGDLYRTFAYRKPSLRKMPPQLTRLDIGLRVDGGCIYCRKVPLTAAEVKRVLRTLSQ